MARSETAVAAGFGVMGLVWAVMALDLTYMGELAPGPGFLPFWLGVTLVVLSIILIARRWLARPDRPAQPLVATTGWRKPAVVAIGLSVCIAAISWLGFLISVSLYLVSLLRFVERRSWALAVIVGVGTPLLLHVVFRAGLGVPLPRGPMGF